MKDGINFDGLRTKRNRGIEDDEEFEINEKWFYQIKEKKKTIIDALKASSPMDLEYRAAAYTLTEDIEKAYKDAKRKILTHKVDRKVPVIVEETTTAKQIGEHGAKLPILEEKEVENPENKNTRVRPVPVKVKKISYKTIKIEEALPPQPLRVDILLPYALYAFAYIEKTDSNYDKIGILNAFKLIIEAIHQIQWHIKEKVPVRLVFSNTMKTEKSWFLIKEERKEREGEITARLNKHCNSHDVDLKILTDEEKAEANNKNMIFGLQFQDYLVPGEHNTSKYSRELNILTNILEKSENYMRINENHHKPNVLLGQNLINAEANIHNELLEYFGNLFELYRFKPKDRYDR